MACPYDDFFTLSSRWLGASSADWPRIDADQHESERRKPALRRRPEWLLRSPIRAHLAA